MPWKVEENGGDCSGEEPWAVINEESGDTEGCHATEEEAQAQAAALYAEEEGGEEEAGAERPFEAVLLVEGVWTGDGRRFAEGATTWPELPVSLRWQEHDNGGHDGATVVGRIDEIERVGAQIIGRGVFASNDAARQVVGLVEEQHVRGVSVDVDAVEFEIEEPDGDDPDPFAMPRMTVLAGRLRAATIVAIPAFVEAQIALTAARGAEVIDLATGAPLVASAAPARPPRAWFDDPQLQAATKLTVTEDGRVLGHVSTWDSCHLDFPGCRQPPRSTSGYAYFHSIGCRDTDSGPIDTGPLSLGGPHERNLRESAGRALAHYDETSMAVADVRLGEDEFGIWCAGALRPDVTEEQVVRLNGSGVSPDWRPIAGSLELIAILAVNAPAFPNRGARALVASGEVRALIAAPWTGDGHGCSCSARLEALEARLSAIEPVARALQGEAVEALAARLQTG